MRHRVRWTGILLALIALSSTVWATPEYSQRYNQTCGLCHHNPTGGGMRTLYGAQFFSYTDLPVKPMSFEEVDKVQPKLSDNVQIGAEFRGIYWIQDDFDSETSAAYEGNDFQLMQADAYLAYTVSDKSLLYLNVSDNGTIEAFAQFRKLPLDGAIKAGRFTPAFGWKFPDHTLYTRRFTGYGSPRGAGPNTYDTGVEFGIYPQGWDVTAGIFNGSAGRGKAAVARLAKRVELAAFKFTLGGSYRYQNIGGAGDFAPTHFGGFYGLQLGDLGFLGEVDIVEDVEDVMGLVSTHQLRYMLQQGIYVNAYYEYFDPDQDTASGWYWRTRLAFDWIPRGYVAVTPSIEWNHEPTQTGDTNEFATGIVQLHLWF